MRKYLFTLLILVIPAVSLAYQSPGKPTGFLNDFANVISVSQKQSLENKLQALQNATSFQVVVATIPSLGNETVETYAVKLFEEWGIGQKGKDTGLLILVAPNDRVAKIETGYGTEGVVTDIQSGNIINKIMIPAFKEGNYSEGISGAVDAVGAIVTNSPEAMPAGRQAEQYSSGSNSNNSSDWGIDPFVIYFLIFIVVNFLYRILGKTKSWWLGGVIGAGMGTIIGLIVASLLVGIISAVVLTIIGLIFDFFVSKHPPGSDKGGGGIWPIFLGGGRGGSGGGFGGFGGGMSGGGGASGRW